MTEEERFADPHPNDMLRNLPNQLSNRKGRLLSCAFLRLVWDSLADKRSRRAVETAELFAEGAANEYDLSRAEAAARLVMKGPDRGGLSSAAYYRAIAAAVAALKKPNPGGVKNFVVSFGGDRERLAQAATNLSRDIVGNPFRPVAFSPQWRTSTAVAIAQGMYESRDFSAMPILADALQDAGCDNDNILNHRRDEKQTHVRGCWLVDMLLGKS